MNKEIQELIEQLIKMRGEEYTVKCIRLEVQKAELEELRIQEDVNETMRRIFGSNYKKEQ